MDIRRFAIACVASVGLWACSSNNDGEVTDPGNGGGGGGGGSGSSTPIIVGQGLPASITFNSTVTSQSLNLSNAFADADTDFSALTFNVDNSNPGLIEATLNGNSLDLSVVGSSDGMAIIEVTASDGQGSVTDTIVVSFASGSGGGNGGGGNPTGAIPAQDLPARGTTVVSLGSVFGTGFTFQVTVENASVVSATIFADQLRLTAGASDGSSIVTVSAIADSDGSISRETFVVSVDNAAPEAIADGLPDLQVRVGETRTLNLTRFLTAGESGDTLSFSVLDNSDTSVASAQISGADLSIGGIALGTATINLRATDGGGEFADFPISVEVSNNNTPPQITGVIADQVLASGESRNLSLVDTFDDDASGLTYEAESEDTDEVRVSTSGTTLTLLAAGTGQARITVTAVDADGGRSDPVSFLVEINNPPTLQDGGIPDLVGPEGDPAGCADATITFFIPARSVCQFSLLDFFEDDDAMGGEPTAYSVSVVDESVVTATIVGSSLRILAGRRDGLTTINVTAEDEAGNAVVSSFTIRIENNAPAPVATPTPSATPSPTPSPSPSPSPTPTSSSGGCDGVMVGGICIGGKSTSAPAKVQGVPDVATASEANPQEIAIGTTRRLSLDRLFADREDRRDELRFEILSVFGFGNPAARPDSITAVLDPADPSVIEITGTEIGTAAIRIRVTDTGDETTEADIVVEFVEQAAPQVEAPVESALIPQYNTTTREYPFVRFDLASIFADDVDSTEELRFEIALDSVVESGDPDGQVAIVNTEDDDPSSNGLIHPIPGGSDRRYPDDGVFRPLRAGLRILTIQAASTDVEPNAPAPADPEEPITGVLNVALRATDTNGRTSDPVFFSVFVGNPAQVVRAFDDLTVPALANRRLPTAAVLIGDPAMVAATLQPRNPRAGEQNDERPVFRHPSNEPLTFTAESSDESVATVEIADNQVFVTSLARDGVATISVTARDALGLFATDDFIVTVVNQAPTFDPSIAPGPVPLTAVDLNDPPLFIDLEALTADREDDASGRQLSFARTLNTREDLVEASVVGTGATLRVRPLRASSDIAQITIRATDSGGEIFDFVIRVRVDGPDPAEVPVFHAPPSQPPIPMGSGLTASFNMANLDFNGAPANGAFFGVCDGIYRRNGTPSTADDLCDTDGTQTPAASLSYAASVNNNSLLSVSFTGATINLTAAAGAVGQAFVRLTATDADGNTSEPFDFVVDIQAAPVFNNPGLIVVPAMGQTAAATQLVRVSLNSIFSDAEDPGQLPAGGFLIQNISQPGALRANNNANNNVLVLQANQFGDSGVIQVRVQATDADGNQTFGDLQVQVENLAPTTIGIPDRSIGLDSGNAFVTLPGFFSDRETPLLNNANGSNLNVALTDNSNSGAVQASLTAANNLQLVPLQVGSATITLTVTDPGGETVVDSFVVTVEDTDLPPQISGAQGDIALRASQTPRDRASVDLIPLFDDGSTGTPDNQLVYTVTSSRPNVVSLSNPNVAPGNPNRSQLEITALNPGSTVISITATDNSTQPNGQGGQTSAPLSFTVQVSSPPVVSPVPGQNFGRNESRSIDFSGFINDEDPDSALSLALLNNSNPAAVSLTSITGLTATLLAADTSATASLTFTVTDTTNLSSNFQVQINVDNAAGAVVTPIPNQNLGANPVTIQLQGTTPKAFNGSNLAYLITQNSNENVVKTRISGSLLTLTPVVGANGRTSQVTVRAVDASSGVLRAEDSFSVTATGPTLAGIPGEPGITAASDMPIAVSASERVVEATGTASEIRVSQFDTNAVDVNGNGGLPANIDNDLSHPILLDDGSNSVVTDLAINDRLGLVAAVSTDGNSPSTTSELTVVGIPADSSNGFDRFIFSRTNVALNGQITAVALGSDGLGTDQLFVAHLDGADHLVRVFSGIAANASGPPTNTDEGAVLISNGGVQVPAVVAMDYDAQRDLLAVSDGVATTGRVDLVVGLQPPGGGGTTSQNSDALVTMDSPRDLRIVGNSLFVVALDAGTPTIFRIDITDPTTPGAPVALQAVGSLNHKLRIIGRDADGLDVAPDANDRPLEQARSILVSAVSTSNADHLAFEFDLQLNQLLGSPLPNLVVSPPNGEGVDNINLSRTGDLLLMLGPASFRGVGVINRYGDLRGRPTPDELGLDRTINGAFDVVLRGRGLETANRAGQFLAVDQANGMIQVFASEAAKDGFPVRSTQLNDLVPWDADYDALNDRLFVVGMNAAGEGQVHIFDAYLEGPTSGPSTAAERVIELQSCVSSTAPPTATGFLHGVSYEPSSDLLIVSDVGSAAAADDGRLLVVPNAAFANGPTCATLSIEGSNTRLDNPVDIVVATDQIGIANVYVADKNVDAVAGAVLLFRIDTRLLDASNPQVINPTPDAVQSVGNFRPESLVLVPDDQ